MMTMTERLDDDIAIRRSLGYDLSFSARVLRGFAGFADSEGADHITVDLFLRWKERFGKASNSTWSTRRGRPYIYSEAEVAAIVVRASKLPSRYGVRGWTCSTIFGLIAVTGLRINEAVALDNDDVDLDESVITVRRGKNGTARYVPVAPSTVTRLREYRAERTRLLGPSNGPFFLMESGERPRLLRALQLRSGQPDARPEGAATLLQARTRAPHPRPQAHLRGQNNHRMVPKGARSGLRDDQAQHLTRPRQAGAHLLVHRGRSRAAPARLKTHRTLTCSTSFGGG
jgi:integrase